MSRLDAATAQGSARRPSAVETPEKRMHLRAAKQLLLCFAFALLATSCKTQESAALPDDSQTAAPLPAVAISAQTGKEPLADPAGSTEGPAPGGAGSQRAPAAQPPAQEGVKTIDGSAVVKPAAEVVPLSQACQERLAEIDALDKAVPVYFDNTGRKPDEINADMLKAIDLCRGFVAECPGTEPAIRVKMILARMLFARCDWYNADLQSERRKLLEAKKPAPEPAELKERFLRYLIEAGTLAGQVLEGSAPASTERRLALKTLSDLEDKLAFVDYARHSEHFQKVRSYAKSVCEEYPDSRECSVIVVTVANSFINEGKYQEAVEYLDRMIKARPKDTQRPLYFDKLFEALTGVGDLERMEELVELMRAEYPLSLAEARDGMPRTQMEQWLCISAFWLGFIRMAQGDNAGAHDFFRMHVREANEHLKEDKDSGRSLQNNVCNIVLNFRTLDLLSVLEEHVGKVPKTELDLLWSTENKLSLKESRGKVVAILFRPPGDVRSSTFLQELQSLVNEHEKDGLVALSMGFLTGRSSPEADAADIEKQRADLQKLGVTLPAGYDPNRKEWNIFRALHATVGTASFAVLNRRGEYAWFLADPRDMDRQILRRVIERLLDEKAEG